MNKLQDSDLETNHEHFLKCIKMKNIPYIYKKGSEQFAINHVFGGESMAGLDI